MSEGFLPVSPGGRRYGRYPDNPNHPARQLRRLTAPIVATLPPSARTSQWMGPIRDQGQEGSCTGQMGASMRDLLYRKLFQYEKDRSIPAASFESSASFVYKSNLIADGDLGEDAGSTIHQTVITLNQKGVCLNSQEQYSDTDYSQAPTVVQSEQALVYKAGAHHYLPDLLTMKACIASGYSFGFGIDVFESFEVEWPVRGVMPMPAPDEKLLGGHAQHVMDYDDNIGFPDGSRGGLYIQNSWGTDWGLDGCYWMPYTYAESQHVTDAWMVHLGPPWAAK